MNGMFFLGCASCVKSLGQEVAIFRQILNTEDNIWIFKILI